MTASRTSPLWTAAKDMLLRELMNKSDIEKRSTEPEYRAAFRLQIGNAPHPRYDFSDITRSPKAIADNIFAAVSTVAGQYRKAGG